MGHTNDEMVRCLIVVLCYAMLSYSISLFHTDDVEYGVRYSRVINTVLLRLFSYRKIEPQLLAKVA